MLLALVVVVGVFASVFVWRRTRRIQNYVDRSLLRAFTIATFYAPTVLIASRPGDHVVVPFPGFAWMSVWEGFAEHNWRALLWGFVPIWVVGLFLTLLFGFFRHDRAA